MLGFWKIPIALIGVLVALLIVPILMNLSQFNSVTGAWNYLKSQGYVAYEALASGNWTVAGDIVPETDNTYDMGQDALRWQDIKYAGKLVGPTIGPATTQQHTLPAVASDTVALLAATQELDNKTLDSSVGKGTWTASGTWTLPAFTLGGTVTLAGQTLSGNATLTGLLNWVEDDDAGPYLILGSEQAGLTPTGSPFIVATKTITTSADVEWTTANIDLRINRQNAETGNPIYTAMHGHVYMDSNTTINIDTISTLMFEAKLNDNNTVTTARGAYLQAQTLGNAPTCTLCIGVEGNVHNNSGTMTTAVGVQASFNGNNTTTTTALKLFRAASPVVSAGNKPATVWGMFFEDLSGSATGNIIHVGSAGGLGFDIATGNSYGFSINQSTVYIMDSTSVRPAANNTYDMGTTGLSWRDAFFRRNLNSYGSLYIGSCGTCNALSAHMTGSASLDYGATGANSCDDLTITVTGAADGNRVTWGVPNALASVAGTTFSAFVSSSNTVTVRRCNVTGSPTADPGAATINVSVWQ